MFIKPPKLLADELKAIKVVVCGGGTGGHVYPAIAIAEALREDLDVDRVFYVGCPDSLEEKVAAEHEFDFLPIRMSGMPRKISFGFIKWLFVLNKAIAESVGYLHYLKPDIVVGTGGYVSGPVLMAAMILNIPYVIHEADANPGIVNKTLAPWASGVSVAFEQAERILENKNIQIFGNPLRASIGEYNRSEAYIFLELEEDKKTLLVLGGSQGAQKINDAVIEVLPELLNDYNLQVIHQCGPKNYEEIKNKLPDEILNNKSYVLKGFFNDLAIPLACADMAISRAGSMTLSELMASMLPAILVPYPFAAADHQRKNANFLVESGAALYLENDQCNGENLKQRINLLLENPEKLDYMRLACSKLAKKTATQDIVNLIKIIVKPSSSIVTKPLKED